MTDRPIPGIETIRSQACWITGRGVVLAMRYRRARQKHWGWLMEWLGL